MLEDSGPIGLSLMVVMAEAFLQVLEAKAIDDAIHLQPPISPLSHLRYVDDSHTRFEIMDFAEKFFKILNQQNDKIKYTMERESPEKKLQFMDISVTNNLKGRYEFDVFRKKAITNVQIKKESGHDPTVLKGIFKGFVHRALSICSTNYLDREIDFLIKIFVENGYQEDSLRKMVKEIRNKSQILKETTDDQTTDAPKPRITLPWIPKISPKLRTVYKKAGYDVAFKSGKNLGTILSAKNKAKLPKNSYPGIYQIPCSCGIPPYRGQTKKKISTRLGEHERNVERTEHDKSAVALHSKDCDGEINFEEARTVTVIHNNFYRKVRESLEIQKHDCHISVGGMNTDKGQYVTTNFWIPLLKYLESRGI